MHLIIRTNAGPSVGIGHLMRCLALAETWHESGGVVTFLTNILASNLSTALARSGFGHVEYDCAAGSEADIEHTIAVARRTADVAGFLDGYAFGPEYQLAVKRHVRRLGLMDDIAHLSQYHADLLINQNIDAPMVRYSHDPGATLLLGTKYAMLRREFRCCAIGRETRAVARRVLVTFGGGDSTNAVLTTLEALSQIDRPGLEVTLIAGAANPRSEIVAAAAQAAPFPVRVIAGATSGMAEVMCWADLAISAAGSTCWELAFLGVPAILVIVAENQSAIANGLEKAGMAKNMGPVQHISSVVLAAEIERLLQSPERRRAMSERGRPLVDGNGAIRVAEALRN
jgi:UDP-2,4-diacetamido-2,4,6-trideoxy-beta-L-altropyranose hydrolase